MIVYAFQSLWNRRLVVALTVLSLAMAIALILGVERLRDSARASFANTASGIDLIIAPRGNDVQILMATVFGVGSTGTAMQWESYEKISRMPGVGWTVPLMMGDNHRGYPVIGTTPSYFEHFRHSGGSQLMFSDGRPFGTGDEAVIGSEVAVRFGYGIGDSLVNAHGAGAVSFEMHDDAPFSVSGILKPTGTAVDRMVFISTNGFDALHEGYRQPAADPFSSAADAKTQEHPQQINAVFLGLSQRTAILGIQRALQTESDEALSAVMPNVALLQLWSITGTAEGALQLMSIAVAAASLIGMVVMLSAALEARRREFAILRSVGAAPRTVFGLIVSEALMMALMGILLGLLLLTVAVFLANPILSANFGFRLQLAAFSAHEMLIVLAVFCFAALASLLPAWRVYRTTLSDGLTARL
ncbi:putative ABC transport system permease protein [Shimia isoporae]|uniref:Putative ABC transport system permease protein n=1 Tax=Shimia isoporae TaxID=647720 RepID=A0A4R1NT34_9RHOB|nr:ABC transporter permease [Shimia isoporae]TCL09963.1 putative ABC transport system permease protein [Shimia isoporae]